ncbi:MAG: enoyl-ACP reductase FabI [Alphaproteobacteria bacterium]|nr:enoyl-ACP reductase FabI [Alphaproteobacteria bacterium]
MSENDIATPGPILKGKRGLVMGVANERSIAWGIARVLAGQGAELAFTYQGDAFGRRAKPLAESVGSKIIVPCDVGDLDSVDNVFSEIEKTWGSLDFVVHALAFSDRRELAGRYADTSRENFTNTMVISCFSFTEVANRAAKLMPNGGSMITLSYAGATRWVPSYNVMGVAKAALEASVRYLASDYGPQGIRVNAISAGPMRTLAGSGVSDARVIFNYARDHAPLRRTPTLDEVGGSALYLLSDLGGAVTGEVHFVDCGYATVAMPTLDALKSFEAGGS